MKKTLALFSIVRRLQRQVSTASSSSQRLGEPFHPIPDHRPVWLNAEQVFDRVLKSEQNIFIHGGASSPEHLVNSMLLVGSRQQLSSIKLLQAYSLDSIDYSVQEMAGVFRYNSLFASERIAQAVATGDADFTPIFLSEVPLLFRRGHTRLDLALVMVTPPDSRGFCSLGPSVDCARAALQSAGCIVAQVNPMLPRTRGDAALHCSHVDYFVHKPQVPLQLLPQPPTQAERKIGSLMAEHLIPDGATLQICLGTIGDATLRCLDKHRDLGIHTEAFSDSLAELADTGAITNANKVVKQGKIAAAFVLGTDKVYSFIDDNPLVELCDAHFVSRVANISRNPRVTAINTCCEIDLTGQSATQTGVGGHVDFLRGAALSHDGKGKPIIAVASVDAAGQSNIVPDTSKGARVVTTRAHAHYVVTEFGIAQLWGRNLRQRAYSLIQIAHPQHREALEKAAFSRLNCMPAPD